MRQPNSYTEYEGGEWKPWPKVLDVNILGLDHYTLGRDNIVVGIGKMGNTYKIHSILWEAMTHVDSGGRWDSINHWTQPLVEQRQ